MKEASRKTAITLFFVRFLRLLVSVVTLSVSAKYFGVGTDREIWILSFNFVTVLNLAIWGPLNETFRAKFIFIKTSEGEAAALKKTSSLLLFTLLILGLVVIILSLCSNDLAKLIAPAYTQDVLLRISVMLQFLLGTVILSQATQLLSSILNTYNSFYIPEITGFFTSILNLVLIVVLSKYIGIYSFLISTYASLIILLLALAFQVRKLKISLFKNGVSVSWTDVKPFIIFSLPFFIPYIIGQCNGLIEKSITTFLGDSAVALLDYSKKITDIIYTVFTSVLASIMVPVLSQKFSEKDLEAVKHESQKYIQMILLALAVILPLFSVCSDSISNILYNKGSISAADLDNIIRLMKLYSFSLLSMFLYSLFGLILLSTNRSKVYATYGVVAQLLMITLNFIFYKKLGIYTFVFTVTIVHLITAILMFIRLPFGKKEFAKVFLKYFSLISVSFGLLFYFNYYLYHARNSYLNILINGLLAVVIVTIFGMLFKVSELTSLKRFVIKSKR